MDGQAFTRPLSKECRMVASNAIAVEVLAQSLNGLWPNREFPPRLSRCSW
jgi:hypothetical protein